MRFKFDLESQVTECTMKSFMHKNYRHLSIQFICILGITSARVLDGELLYTKILEVNLFAFAYRLFHEKFLPNQRDILHEQYVPLIGEKSL